MNLRATFGNDHLVCFCVIVCVCQGENLKHIHIYHNITAEATVSLK